VLASVLRARVTPTQSRRNVRMVEKEGKRSRAI
jgi:hypothetical protein